ncbi:hypothetical protein P691DRAFT_730976 [Macrolepiota fuliginosa MF-IS2]|uniref:ATP-dependent DNA ligase family profile domain-containing protein n=1 Tax=Macrolepiota fuliginosa MF-IS2 TaxID=1400762 RepID=A0A9P5XCD0_9AGAR|nr:hypothetical protein P691DRAFT_730976 [Macrolepiota fuliginosa MF-IS2]
MAVCFRLLFPEEDTRRKYDIQETRLASYLAQGLGLPSESLENWDTYDSSGCLGIELGQLLSRKFPDPNEASSPLTIIEIDELLDELAATSQYTHISIRNKYPHDFGCRSKLEILKALFRQLPPTEATFMTQMILKDLRPVLYPFPEVNCSVALLDFNSNAVRMLTKEHALGAWDPTGYALKLHRVKASLDEVIMAFDLPNHMKPALKPTIGCMIQLPKSVKGTSCRHALSHFQGSVRVWAETKYDGERAQIHVEIREDGSPNITIFSKSKRDSTRDRHGVHDIIRETLDLNSPNRYHSRTIRVKKNIVLDAEIVAWYKDHIDEFWRIRGLIEQTGSGVRGTAGKKMKDSVSQDEEGCDSQLSMMADASQSRHLALVFFDILVLDDEPLIFQVYSARRRLLETCVKPIPTKAMISERHNIDMTRPDPDETLKTIFAEHLANHLEGLVLKADESQYNEIRLPWVKLKKDYIEGFGDCLDLVVVAAGWDRDRARELRVTPSTYTTFYVGAITNTSQIRVKPDTKPHIIIYFTVSYGLSRKELEDLNFRIRNGDNISYPAAAEEINGLPFAPTLSAHLQSEPQIILQSPFLAELLCAGFSKEHRSRHYEPRFPRLTKIHDARERPWTACMDINEVDRIARECIGKDPSNKDIDDWCKSLWGKQASPTISMKQWDRVQDIRERLASLEGRLRDSKGQESFKHRKLDHPLEKTTTFSRTSGGATVPGKMVEFVHDNTRDVGNEHLSHSPLGFAGVTPGGQAESHSGLLATSVSCFMNSRRDQPCDRCSRWKALMPRGRRVHSLDALLVACEREKGSLDIKQGFVFVDVDDSTATEWTLQQVRSRAGNIKAQILVFGCNVDSLSEETALLVV